MMLSNWETVKGKQLSELNALIRQTGNLMHKKTPGADVYYDAPNDCKDDFNDLCRSIFSWAKRQIIWPEQLLSDFIGHASKWLPLVLEMGSNKKLDAAQSFREWNAFFEAWNSMIDKTSNVNKFRIES
jgi:hypothetical protein